MYGYKDVPSVASDAFLLLLNGMYNLWYYHTCNLHVFHLVPVQVSDVSVNTVTSTSMTVTWTPPNANTYSAITQYNISYVTSCLSGQTISNSTTVTHPTTSVTLTDLEEGLNYTITVTAVNVLGESTATLIVQGTNATGSFMYVLILCIKFFSPKWCTYQCLSIIYQ